MTTTDDNELKAFKDIHGVLSPLDAEVRGRVLKAIVALLGIDVALPSPRRDKETNEIETTSDYHQSEDNISFLTFADLFDRADPTTLPAKALIAGYWLQVCKGGEKFTAHMANKELTNLGHRISNITSALDSLKSSKPALVLQLGKSGSSKQARKTYKLSTSGEKEVRRLINGDDEISEIN